MTILNHFELETIEIVMENGDTRYVPALVYGCFAIHEHQNWQGYTVTIRPSGRGSTDRFPNLESAARYIALLNGFDLDWGTCNRNPSAKLRDLYGDHGVRVYRVLRAWQAARAEAQP